VSLRLRQEVQALSWPPGLIGRQVGSWKPEDRLAEPILVLGAPRSGTTWLAKIIDSHPDVLYRHEPDETRPSPLAPGPADLSALLTAWIGDRSSRTAAKRPFFPKNWQSGSGRALRTGLVAAMAVASRTPALRPLSRLPVPDFAHRPALRVALKSIRWAQGAAVLAQTLPDSRTILILRHPCGQVASVMRGNRQRRFDLRTAGTDMPFHEAHARAHAAAQGIDDGAFQALPDAARYAWSWRAFNEPAYVSLARRPNVCVVLYEALCATPEAVARRIMAFAGLGWNDQTSQFVRRSSSRSGEAGYYSVFRNAGTAAGRWQTTMPAWEQTAVRSVVAASPLACFWPDLLPSEL